jgi:hypothetical protein
VPEVVVVLPAVAEEVSPVVVMAVAADAAAVADKEDRMMLNSIDTVRRIKVVAASAVLLLLLFITFWTAFAAATGEPAKFGTPEAAAEALITAMKNNDQGALTTLFGASYADKLLAKNQADTRKGRERLYLASREGLTLRRDKEDRVTLLLGSKNWPFPIPLVRSGDSWYFNTAEGLEEITNRRIGSNELKAIEVCRDYMAAQKEYAAKIRDKSGVRKFAQRLVSTPGKQDGLYWDPISANGEESPFGPLMAEFLGGGRKKVDPYHGYYFRILTGQGKRAPGGQYNYVINGNMIGGFALVAFPAEYGKTGIMTFLVSHHGQVLQKNLGPKTQKIAGQMKAYNPDASWVEVKD